MKAMLEAIFDYAYQGFRTAYRCDTRKTSIAWSGEAKDGLPSQQIKALGGHWRSDQALLRGALTRFPSRD